MVIRYPGHRSKTTFSKRYMRTHETSIAHSVRARRSGVDRHVCNVKATGSNPVESILIFIFFSGTDRSRRDRRAEPSRWYGFKSRRVHARFYIFHRDREVTPGSKGRALAVVRVQIPSSPIILSFFSSGLLFRIISPPHVANPGNYRMTLLLRPLPAHPEAPLSGTASLR